MASEREIHIRDTMRVPLRKIVDFVRLLEGSFEEDGIAELKLHSLMSEYIEARATFAGVRWRRGIDEPLQAEWCAALLERSASTVAADSSSPALAEMPAPLLHELTRQWDFPAGFSEAREALKSAYREGATYERTRILQRASSVEAALLLINGALAIQAGLTHDGTEVKCYVPDGEGGVDKHYLDALMCADLARAFVRLNMSMTDPVMAKATGGAK